VGIEPSCDHFHLFQRIHPDQLEAESVAKNFGLVAVESVDRVEEEIASVDRHEIVNRGRFSVYFYVQIKLS